MLSIELLHKQYDDGTLDARHMLAGEKPPLGKPPGRNGEAMVELGFMFGGRKGKGNSSNNSKRARHTTTRAKSEHSRKGSSRSPHRQRSKRASSSSNHADLANEDQKLQQDIATWNRKRLENKMIVWKDEHPGKNFQDFLIDKMPENVKTDENGVVCWIDPRLERPLWKGAFGRVQAGDLLNEIGDAPS